MEDLLMRFITWSLVRLRAGLIVAFMFVGGTLILSLVMWIIGHLRNGERKSEVSR